MRKKTAYQELRVYQLAEELADTVWSNAIKWPETARRTVGEQLIRAADSIGANIAEGAGKGSFRENRRFAYIARGSLYETQHWLRRASRRGLLTTTSSNHLKEIMDNLIPQFNAWINHLDSKI